MPPGRGVRPGHGPQGASQPSTFYVALPFEDDRNCKCDEFAFIMPHCQQPANTACTMIVCVCRRVSDREIARHAHAGMSFDEIQFELGVATQCGRCESCARDVVAQCSVSHPVAALHKEIASQTIQLANSILESKAWNCSQPSQAA